MRALLATAVLWTFAFLMVLLFFGDVAPCPELRPVGLPGTDREAIAQMCESRYRATEGIVLANQPWSWLVIWGLGIGAIAAGARRMRR